MSDPVSLASLFDAAEQAAMRGDFAAAARLLGEAARAQEAALGPDHLDLANTLNNLAVAHERSGQLDAAEREYRRAHAIAARTRPADDPLVTTSAQNLREFCEANGRPVDVPPSALTLADDTSISGRSGHAARHRRPQGHADPPTVPIAPLAITFCRTGAGQATIRSADGRRLGAACGGAGETGRGTDAQAGACGSRGHDRAGTLGARTRRGAACRFRSSSRSAPSPRSSSGCWRDAVPRHRLGTRQQPRPTRRQPPQPTRPSAPPAAAPVAAAPVATPDPTPPAPSTGPVARRRPPHRRAA